MTTPSAVPPLKATSSTPKFWTGTSTRFATIGSALIVLAFALLRPLAPAFLYDARMYWGGALALISGGDVAAEGGLGLRGLLSSLIYLPAAGVSVAFGPEAAAIAVLLQNAIALAFIGSWLLPKLAAKLVKLEAWHIWASGGLTAVVSSGFSPYPLMDIWAMLFLLLGVLLLASEHRILLVAAGAAFAITLDLRPAFLVPIFLIAVLWTVSNWRLVIYALAGGIAGFLPQIIFNKHVFEMWSIFAPDTFAIAGIQSASASFLVRYDTVAFVAGTDPRQAYCSPAMSALVSGAPPTSTPELLLTFVQNPWEALLFSAQKVSAAVTWDWDTPYSRGPHEWIGFFGVLTIAVASIGLIALVKHMIAEPKNAITLQILALWLATAATIVVSTPEARFGLPLLMVGILGVLTIPRPSQDNSWNLRVSVLLLVIAGVLITLVIAFASTGLAHPAPPGPWSATVCDTN